MKKEQWIAIIIVIVFFAVIFGIVLFSKHPLVTAFTIVAIVSIVSGILKGLQ